MAINKQQKILDALDDKCDVLYRLAFNPEDYLYHLIKWRIVPRMFSIMPQCDRAAYYDVDYEFIIDSRGIVHKSDKTPHEYYKDMKDWCGGTMFAAKICRYCLHDMKQHPDLFTVKYDTDNIGSLIVDINYA
jgi:hypothetical protein